MIEKPSTKSAKQAATQPGQRLNPMFMPDSKSVFQDIVTALFSNANVYPSVGYSGVIKTAILIYQELADEKLVPPVND